MIQIKGNKVPGKEEISLNIGGNRTFEGLDLLYSLSD